MLAWPPTSQTSLWTPDPPPLPLPLPPPPHPLSRPEFNQILFLTIQNCQRIRPARFGTPPPTPTPPPPIPTKIQPHSSSAIQNCQGVSAPPVLVAWLLGLPTSQPSLSTPENCQGVSAPLVLVGSYQPPLVWASSSPLPPPNPPPIPPLQKHSKFPIARAAQK